MEHDSNADFLRKRRSTRRNCCVPNRDDFGSSAPSCASIGIFFLGNVSRCYLCSCCKLAFAVIPFSCFLSPILHSTGSTSTVATSSTAGSASVQASSFLPPALVSSMGLALPTDFSSVHSLFRHNSSSSEDVPSAVAATAPTSNESRSSSPSESAASGLATRQAPRPSFTLNPRSRGAAFVETTTSTTTFTPPGILRTSSSVSWTGTAHGETSSSARTSSSTDLTVIDELARDNALLRHDVNQKNLQIQAMQERIGQLEARITEFKQMPVGKISQIPVSDMLELMQTYGSEVSEHTQLPSSLHPNGKRTVQKASIVRQFRRWNPNFTEYFEFRCGKWVPKLGVQAELQRRAQNRAERRAQKAASIHKKQPNNSKDSS